jgi:hypothetical protein
VKEALVKGNISEELKERLDKAFHPLQACGGSNWRKRQTTKNKTKNDPQCKKSGKSDGKQSTTDGLLDDALHLSPNVISMFLPQSGFPKIGLDTPDVNHRALHMKRVWCKENIGTDDNPGVIGSLMGLNNKVEYRELYLSEMRFVVFPYRTAEKQLTGNDDETSACEYVFAHEKEAANSHLANHVSMDDAARLIGVLCEVRYFHCFC